jgi:hypothetical protein
MKLASVVRASSALNVPSLKAEGEINKSLADRIYKESLI